jgi:carbonic anhydrase
MDRLIAGYREFRKTKWPVEKTRYETLADHGQRPRALVIACSDSRADPATIFNARPGELFVIRNVAAVVPPYETDTSHHGTSAAIAFAVLSLNVSDILVMGHAQCGGVAAALDHSIADGVPFLKSWIDLLEPAVKALPAHDHTALERETVKLSLARLMEFPFIAERVGGGALKLHGARFGIADGKLEMLDSKTGEFVPID